MFARVMNNFDLFLFVSIMIIISPKIVETFYANMEPFLAATAIYFALSYLLLRKNV